MADQVARSMEIHLLYASIVWLAAWLVTSMRGGSATAKYWIWVATSLYFVLPLGAALNRMPLPLLLRIAPLSLVRVASVRLFPSIWIVAIWALGAAAMLVRLWLRIRAAHRGGPAVHGLLRPRIILPDGIEEWLSEEELDAVLAHERTHARRRDNLMGLIYELGLCALWFHPLVWLTGSRLALYRELSCDESVSNPGDLISALGKLANPERASLVQSSASSLISGRVARLTSHRRTSLAANAFLTAVFLIVLLSSVFGSAVLFAEGSRCKPAEISEVNVLEQALGAVGIR